jgi:hypothetical protein
MTEVEQIQTIIIAKALYALQNTRQTVKKYKCHKRALNKIARVTERALYEIDLVKDRLLDAQHRSLNSIKF